MSIHPIDILAQRYYQLRLPLFEGISSTDIYKNAVLRGIKPDAEPDFSFSSDDRLENENTPAGNVEILFLKDRADFEHAARALAYKCEMPEIPASMGAVTVLGLINWEKLSPHVETDFDDFIKNKSNYLDTLIILSDGPYSAVPADAFNMPEQQWLSKSYTIRKYHELAHFVSRKLYPNNKESIRDEILADMTGIIAAFGYYDVNAAKTFLGIESHQYRPGGRLENYIDAGTSRNDVIHRADELISLFCDSILHLDLSDPFSSLQYLEERKTGLNH